MALDVYIVRLWLAPAALCIFEQANYWPGKVPDPTKCCLAHLAHLAHGTHGTERTTTVLVLVTFTLLTLLYFADLKKSRDERGYVPDDGLPLPKAQWEEYSSFQKQ